METEDWKHYPQTWYAVAIASRVRVGDVLAGQLGGMDYVLYRGDSGSLKAMDAFCPHMGAHLQSGQVSGDSVVCGLHGCLIQPQHSSEINDGVGMQSGCCLSNRAWFCVERFGLVWLYPPVVATMPTLPFSELNEEDYRWTHTVRHIAADWRAMICNGFDIAHMKIVHQREVVGEPQFFRLPEKAIRMDYQTRVLAKGGISSAIMQKLSGGKIVLSHTCIGSAIMVQSQVGVFRTVGIFALLPQDLPDTPPEHRHTYAFAAMAVPKSAEYSWLKLMLAKMLYWAFLRKDFVVVEKMRMRLENVDDVGVQAVAEFQATLPDMVRKD